MPARRPGHALLGSLTLALTLTPACSGGHEQVTGATSGESTSSWTFGEASTSAGSTSSTPTTDEETGASTTSAPCGSDRDCAETEHCSIGACVSLCGHEQVFLVPIVVPRVALVVDTSASMTIANVDHDDDPNTPLITRWRLLHDGLFTALAGVDGVAWATARTTSIRASQGYDAGACAAQPAPLVGLDAEVDAAAAVAALPPADADTALLAGRGR